MEQAIHFIIVIPIIILIIGFQVHVFRKALSKIDSFKQIFPGNRLAYSVEKTSIVVETDELDDDDSDNFEPVYTDENEIWSENDDTEKYSGPSFRTVEVSQISVKSENATMNSIKNALNMYLQKNQGAVSDFALMKDVVERHCGSEEEEISVMQPIPLYMGLMGTMIGIIVGIGIIAFKEGGLAAIADVSSLMKCVALAMIASFVGIFFTTVISWKSKDAKTTIESNKNTFYSWLQTELLPVLSGNAVTALSLLQTNLMAFNSTFQGNIREFDSVLSNVRQVSKDQSDALGAISRIDIARVAKANITVLKELEKCTAQIDRFAGYLNSVNDYVANVNQLNNNLNNHLDRTAAVEKMGTFFEREMTQVESREEYIKQVVASVDTTLEQSFNHLSTTMTAYIEQLRTQSSNEIESIKNAFEAQQQEFITKLRDQQAQIEEKTNDMEKVLKGIQALSETKSAIVDLASLTKENTKRLDIIADLLEASSSGTVSVSAAAASVGDKKTKKKGKKWVNALNIALKIAAILAFLMFAYEFALKFFVS